MKIVSIVLALCLLFSCTKKSPTDDTQTPPSKAGAVSGTIKAYDKYGAINASNGDVIVKLIDQGNKAVTSSLNAGGMFRFENVGFGKVTLVVTKPGYGFIDSVSFNHHKPADTLTDIALFEELPFSPRLNSLSYFNSMLNVSCTYNYPTAESYMVAEIFCFSKDPNVSINHNSLFIVPGGQTNVQVLSSVATTGVGIPLQTMTNAGFKAGDKIYATIIPSISKLFQAYHDQSRNYTILHYKISNASNTVSFTLN